MPSTFRRLTDVINGEKAFSGFRKTVKENDVVLKFSELFPELSKTVEARSVSKGILYLSTENSVLKSELFLQRNLIVEKINTHFKENVIVDIKFSKI